LNANVRVVPFDASVADEIAGAVVSTTVELLTALPLVTLFTVVEPVSGSVYVYVTTSRDVMTGEVGEYMMKVLLELEPPPHVMGMSSPLRYQMNCENAGWLTPDLL
jgi:hypothetical protein